LSEAVSGSSAPARRLLEAAAVGTILTAGLILRLWKLDELPPVFFHDECDNAANAMQILLGSGPGLYGLDWKPQPAFAVHLIALSLWACGPSVLAVRLPAALFGTAGLLVFYWVARQAVRPLPALLAMFLLSTHVGYLHFSRTGWENVQTCFYALLAMGSVRQAMRSGNLAWWLLAGVSSGLAALTYFAGRLVLLACLGQATLCMVFARGSRLQRLRGFALLLGAYLATVAPLAPTLLEDWTLFQRRTSSVLITRELPDDVSLEMGIARFVERSACALQFVVDGSVYRDERYFPPDRPLLDPVRAALFVAGALVACLRFRAFSLWWLMLLLPYLLTQGLTTGTPNLARGILVLPMLHLFMALGLDVALRHGAGRWRILSAAALALTLWLGGSNVASYLGWARSAPLRAVLQPAVELADFEEWWAYQEAHITRSEVPPHVGLWLEHQRERRANRP
jgi:4-amino-4-deoxy-L-arabinose transferase-like glycosyltransferase